MALDGGFVFVIFGGARNFRQSRISLVDHGRIRNTASDHKKLELRELGWRDLNW